MVKDIELVCIPKITKYKDVFDYEYKESELNKLLKSIGSDWEFTKNGEKYKQFRVGKGIKFDLFITTKEQWGLIFAIRTGSDKFSKRLVTAKKYGGLKPSDLTVKDGWIKYKDKKMPVYEERELFELFNIDWIEPERRK